MIRKTLTLKKSKPKLTKRGEKTTGTLCDEWLHTFPLFQKHVPMQIGIREILQKIHTEQYESGEITFGWSRVKRQLGHRVRKDWYKQALRDGVPRHTLEGEPIDQH